jgi:hypothetical protein
VVKLVKITLYLLLPIVLLVLGFLSLAPLNVANASSVDEQIPISSAPTAALVESSQENEVIDEITTSTKEDAVEVEEMYREGAPGNNFLLYEPQTNDDAYVPLEDSTLFEDFDPSEVDSELDNGLSDFIQSVATGNPDMLTGVFVADLFALDVQPQPAGSPAYVSDQEGVATQFGLASDFGSIALMAHNHLSGSVFGELVTGDEVYIVYGDGRVEGFIITDTRRLQALQPYSPYSDFLDLDNDNARLTATELFYQVYDQPEYLILLTCITSEGIDAWGRLFVIAEPLT